MYCEIEIDASGGYRDKMWLMLNCLSVGCCSCGYQCLPSPVSCSLHRLVRDDCTAFVASKCNSEQSNGQAGQQARLRRDTPEHECRIVQTGQKLLGSEHCYVDGDLHRRQSTQQNLTSKNR